MMAITALVKNTIRNMFDDKDKKYISIHIDDLHRIVEWYECMDKTSNTSSNIKIYSTSSGIGPIIKAYVETGDREGVWKDFTDYSTW
jgi:adenylosuccinate synthase